MYIKYPSEKIQEIVNRLCDENPTAKLEHINIRALIEYLDEEYRSSIEQQMSE